MLETSESEYRLKLRVALKAMLGLAAVAALVVAVDFLVGGDAAGTGAAVRYSLAGVAPGTTRTVGFNGRPVIVLHRPEALARRLARQGRAGRHPAWFVAFATGTGQGCPLLWEPARETFRETCGDARYDATGQPLQDDGVAALRRPPYRLEGDTLILGPR